MARTSARTCAVSPVWSSAASASRNRTRSRRARGGASFRLAASKVTRRPAGSNSTPRTRPTITTDFLGSVSSGRALAVAHCAEAKPSEAAARGNRSERSPDRASQAAHADGASTATPAHQGGSEPKLK